MRLTYGQLVNDSRICIPLNLGPTDDRLLKYVNEACERFFWKGENFWGLTQRFAMCVRNNCVTLPRQVAAIESIWVCGQPLTIRNQWFESLASGPGLQSNRRGNGSCSTGNCSGNNGWLYDWNSSWGNTYDRGQACTFRDIVGVNKKVRVYADVAEAEGAVINLQGYDENGIWIRTEPDGEGTGWIEGENVAISTTPTNSTKIFSNLVAVQKPITNGNVRLYTYNTDDATQIAIAVYEPSETLPTYRRVFIPGLECVQCCNDLDEEGEACELKKIDLIGRMEFIPAQVAADWILPACPSAIKDMVQSIRLMENNNPEEAMVCEARALSQLKSQLRHYLGHAQVIPIRMQSNSVANPGGVQQIW